MPMSPICSPRRHEDEQPAKPSQSSPWPLTRTCVRVEEPGDLAAPAGAPTGRPGRRTPCRCRSAGRERTAAGSRQLPAQRLGEQLVVDARSSTDGISTFCWWVRRTSPRPDSRDTAHDLQQLVGAQSADRHDEADRRGLLVELRRDADVVVTLEVRRRGGRRGQLAARRRSSSQPEASGPIWSTRNFSRARAALLAVLRVSNGDSR